MVRWLQVLVVACALGASFSCGHVSVVRSSDRARGGRSAASGSVGRLAKQGVWSRGNADASPFADLGP